jgi:hypothetical protein
MTGGKMKNTFLEFLFATFTTLLLIPGSADAHHGWAAYDQTKVITLKASVTDFNFVNPHCVLEFEAKDDKGQLQKWQGSLPSRSALTPRGWTANSLKTGDELTINGYPAKSGAPSIWILRILLPNGKELKLDHDN